MSTGAHLRPDRAAVSAALASLGAFVAPRVRQRPAQRCEMCAASLTAEHTHVVDIGNRRLLCTCRACYLLFTAPGAAGGKFRAVPDSYRALAALQLTDAQWDMLQIPVRIAFFFYNSSLERVVAFYPSPAGATESLLPLQAWQEVATEHAVLSHLDPDVEALLVYGRRGTDGFECFLVPIDACYELTGLVRKRWKGFDGGDEAWNDIETFFANVRARSRTIDPGATA